jgi:hypothetical protein
VSADDTNRTVRVRQGLLGLFYSSFLVSNPTISQNQLKDPKKWPEAFAHKLAGISLNTNL